MTIWANWENLANSVLWQAVLDASRGKEDAVAFLRGQLDRESLELWYDAAGYDPDIIVRRAVGEAFQANLPSQAQLRRRRERRES